MHTLQTIALLGATGKAGNFILNILLSQGYNVKALVREPASFTIQHPQLTIVEGDALNKYAVINLLEHCQAVISAIGQRQNQPLVALAATRNIIAAMHQHNLKRYIFLSGLNLDVPGDSKGPATTAKSDWMRSHFPDAVADKQQAFELVASSDLHWTMIRIPMLEQCDEMGELKVDLLDSPGETVSAGGLANFVVSQLADVTYLSKAPFVSN